MDRQNAIEVFFRLREQCFDLAAILWCVGLVAEVSQLPFAVTHVLLAHAVGVTAIDGRRTGRRSLCEGGTAENYQEGDR